MSFEDIKSEAERRRFARSWRKAFRSCFLTVPEDLTDGLAISASAQSAWENELSAADLDPRTPSGKTRAAERHVDEVFDVEIIDPQRYSFDFPALYVSREKATCIEERKTLILRRVSAGHEVPLTVDYFDLRCEIGPRRVSIFALCAKYPELMADSWKLCQEIGAHFKKRGLAGIEYSSSRRRKGKNIVAFERVDVKREEIVSCSSYKLDPSRSAVSAVSTARI